MADNFTQVTRPYPHDRPDLVTDWNPACECGHAKHAHDYAGDQYRAEWGVCDVDGCLCTGYRDAEDDE